MMRTIRGTGLFLLLVVVIMASCKGDTKDLIPRRKLVRLLAEIHIADGIAVENIAQRTGPRIDSTSLYSALFRKHGVTRAEFDSTMTYYSTRPEELQKFYTQVTAILKKKEAQLKRRAEISIAGTGSVVWNEFRSVSLPEMGKNEKVDIDIPVPDTGLYAVIATIRMYKDDGSINPRMTLYYYHDDKTPQGHRDYFEEVTLQKDDKEHIYTLAKRLTDPNFTRIMGTVLNHSNPDTFFRKHAIVSSLTLIRR